MLLLLHSCAAGIGACQKRNLGSVLRGDTPFRASVGHPGYPGPTRNRALAHHGETDLFADGPPKYPIGLPIEKLHTTRVGALTPVPTRNDGER